MYIIPTNGLTYLENYENSRDITYMVVKNSSRFRSCSWSVYLRVRRHHVCYTQLLRFNSKSYIYIKLSVLTITTDRVTNREVPKNKSFHHHHMRIADRNQQELCIKLSGFAFNIMPYYFCISNENSLYLIFKSTLMKERLRLYSIILTSNFAF